MTEDGHRAVKVVAVFPQPVDVSQRYLAREGVRVDAVKQAPLGMIGIGGTPTMVLVNSAGTVTKVWVGELRSKQQAMVLAALGG